MSLRMQLLIAYTFKNTIQSLKMHDHKAPSDRIQNHIRVSEWTQEGTRTYCMLACFKSETYDHHNVH